MHNVHTKLPIQKNEKREYEGARTLAQNQNVRPTPQTVKNVPVINSLT